MAQVIAWYEALLPQLQVLIFLAVVVALGLVMAEAWNQDVDKDLPY